MRLIDADAVRDDFINTVYAVCASDDTNDRANSIIDAFDSLPEVDAEPVRHGEWKKIQNFAKCTECRHEVNWGSKDFLSPYCPNCGAKMERGSER